MTHHAALMMKTHKTAEISAFSCCAVYAGPPNFRLINIYIISGTLEKKFVSPVISSMLSSTLQFPETEEISLVARYHAIRGPDVAAVPRRRYVDLVQADMRRHLCNEQDRFTNIFFLPHPRLLFGTRRFWA